jgi:flagellar basal-body rod modification protein FlgD
MEITQTTGTRSRPLADDTATQPSAISSDFETFLRMLTVQMQNQDPLNPLQSSDFAVQLATFSGVEQQVRTNELLQNLAEGLGGSAIGQFADWIGKEVQSTAPARFDCTPIEIETTTIARADSAELVVRDQSGRIVDRRPVPIEGGTVTWDGRAPTGESFLTGLYSFTVESRADGEAIGERPAETRGTVTEARIGAGSRIELLLDGGATVTPDEVTALRLPDA